MSVLLLCEGGESGTLGSATRSAASAAARLGAVTAMVAGHGVGELASEVARLSPVEKVLLFDDPALAHGLADIHADLLASYAGSYRYIVAAATTYSKDVIPRLAGKLDVMALSDVVEIIDGSTFVRPIYAGNALETLRSRDAIKLITIRTTQFEEASDGDAAPIETLAVQKSTSLIRHLSTRAPERDRAELTSARIVVSGGRGVGSRENFKLVEALADKLNAAVGASRAAVDAGYATNDLQVGQTGKVVAPDLYIAIGISGAIQHLAGMKDSKVIVAINKDPDAPIFRVADYGLVGDLFSILPELTEALENKSSERTGA